MRNFAVRTAADGVGTGKSSLSYLRSSLFGGGARLFINRGSSPASAICYRLPSNQPRIRPDACRGQLRVSLASPRYLVVGGRRGDFSHARPGRIRHCKPAMLEWALVDAHPCALNDRLLRLLRHVRPPHQTAQAYAMSALASSTFGLTRRALTDARHGLIRLLTAPIRTAANGPETWPSFRRDRA